MAYSDDKKAGPPDLFERLKGQYKTDLVKTNTWRREATEDFKFRDGDQWSEDDKAALEEQHRPVVVFNRTGVLVDAVVGSEIGNRREVRYIPRESQDGKPNEMLTSAAEWFRDCCDAEDEESEAFKDTVTAGMGWTETRLDFTSNPDGEPKIERVDPMEMVWDGEADKANLVDTRRRWRVRRMDLSAAKELLPGVDPDLINAAWADDEDDDKPHRNDPGSEYRDEDGSTENSLSKQVLVVACQYLEKEVYYKALIQTPDGQPQVVELDEEKFKVAEKVGAVVKSVRLTRQRVMQCFLGATTIIKKPVPTQTGTFTWNCITGLKDHAKGIFYGIVRRAKDPQRWANKWLSQMMHILNSQAKGGIMAEDGAFADVREAEANWARPDAITKLTKNALSGAGGPRIQPKPTAQFPAGFDRLLQYADDMIIKATGINMELLGMREVNQPGVLEYQRKQQGIAILASFFDSLRRYRKIQGRAMLRLIQDHLADGRLVRVVGEEQAQYVPLMKEDVADVEYDIIVDDAPSSTNEKEKTWQIIQAMMPFLKDAMTPELGMLIAEYSPLPTSFVEKVKELTKQPPPPDPAQQAAMELQQKQLALEELKLANEAKNIELQMFQEQNKAREIELKAGIESEKINNERIQLKNDELTAYEAMNSQAEEKTTKQTQDSAVFDALAAVMQSNQQIGQLMQGLSAAVQMMAAPKKTTIVRGPDGRSSHSVTEAMVN